MSTLPGDGVLNTVAINLRRTVPIALLMAVLCGCERSPEQRPVTVSTPIKRPQPSAFQSQTEALSPLIEAAPDPDTAARVEAVPHKPAPKPARRSMLMSAEQTLPTSSAAVSGTGGTLAADQSVEPTRFEALSRADEVEPASRNSAIPAPSLPAPVRLSPVPIQGPPTSFLPADG